MRRLESAFSCSTGPGKRGHTVGDTLLLMMFLRRANVRDTKRISCFHASQTWKHLLRTQNVSEQNQKHFLCPGHKICIRNKCCARGQTGKHLCRQQCVLLKQLWRWHLQRNKFACLKIRKREKVVCTLCACVFHFRTSRICSHSS